LIVSSCVIDQITVSSVVFYYTFVDILVSIIFMHPALGRDWILL